MESAETTMSFEQYLSQKKHPRPVLPHHMPAKSEADGRERLLLGKQRVWQGSLHLPPSQEPHRHSCWQKCGGGECLGGSRRD